MTGRRIAALLLTIAVSTGVVGAASGTAHAGDTSWPTVTDTSWPTHVTDK